MIRNLRVIVSICLMSCMAVLCGAAPIEHLQKVWEFRISSVPGLQPPGSVLGVYGLGFSNDHERIAAVIGRGEVEQALLILGRNNPSSTYIKVLGNVKTLAYTGERMKWSPSGQYILAVDRIVNTTNGGGCRISDGKARQFTRNNELIVTYWSRVEILDMNCKTIRSWALPDGNELIDQFAFSPERGLLFIETKLWENAAERIVSQNFGLQYLVDVNGWKILWQRPVLFSSSNGAVDSSRLLYYPDFADTGNAICGNRGARCLSTDTGQTLIMRKVGEFEDADTISRMPWLVISEYKRKFDWIDLFWAEGALKKRSIWDLQSGKEIASWSPKSQKAGAVGERDVPFVYDISANGNFLVEGGSGVITLFRIQQ